MWFLESRFAYTTKNVNYDKKSFLRTSKKGTELNNFKSLEFSAFYIVLKESGVKQVLSGSKTNLIVARK